MMTNVDTDRLVKMISAFKDKIKDEFRHQLGIKTEDQRTSRRYRGALSGLPVIE